MYRRVLPVVTYLAYVHRTTKPCCRLYNTTTGNTSCTFTTMTQVQLHDATFNFTPSLPWSFLHPLRRLIPQLSYDTPASSPDNPLILHRVLNVTHAHVHACSRADTPGPIPIKIGLLVATHDVIKLSNFCNKIFRGFRSTGVKMPVFSFTYLYNSCRLAACDCGLGPRRRDVTPRRSPLHIH